MVGNKAPSSLSSQPKQACLFVPRLLDNWGPLDRMGLEYRQLWLQRDGQQLDEARDIGEGQRFWLRFCSKATQTTGFYCSLFRSSAYLKPLGCENYRRRAAHAHEPTMVPKRERLCPNSSPAEIVPQEKRLVPQSTPM